MPNNKSNHESSEEAVAVRCAGCGAISAREADVPYTAKVKHDGRTYEIQIPALRVLKCESEACGEMMFIAETDEQISAALREHLHLLRPGQIREELHRLGTKQKEFAVHLGVAAETVSRWVNGTMIQSRAMDRFMRVYFHFPAVQSALADENQVHTLGTSPPWKRPSSEVHSWRGGGTAMRSGSLRSHFGPDVLEQAAAFEFVTSPLMRN